MRFSRPTWIGLSLIAAGVLGFSGWVLWSDTRIYIPVNIPISLAVGHVQTPEFSVNLNMPYNIRIEAQKTIPFDNLSCMMGMSFEQQKCDTASVIDASWTLKSNGKVLAQGSSQHEKGRGSWNNDTIERQIGSFNSERGRKYLLDVNILSDGRSLAQTHPRLTVEVTRDMYEGNAWITLFLFWPCAFLVLLGFIFVIIAAARHRNTRLAAGGEA